MKSQLIKPIYYSLLIVLIFSCVPDETKVSYKERSGLRDDLSDSVGNNFSGIINADNITHNQIRLIWERDELAEDYLIYKYQNEEFIFRGVTSELFWIAEDLIPDTKYYFTVYPRYSTSLIITDVDVFEVYTLKMRPFKTRWRTDNDGETEDNQIRLPLNHGYDYDFVVEWGDGTSSHITSWNQDEITHTYTEPGIYDVSIRGKLPSFAFNQHPDIPDSLKANGGDAQKLISIRQWGDIEWKSLNGMLSGISSEVILDDVSDTPDLSNIEDISYFLSSINYSSPVGLDLSDWDFSGVSNFSYIIAGSNNITLIDLNKWDTSSMESMEGFFMNASNITLTASGLISLPRLKNISKAFKGCTNCNVGSFIAFLDTSRINNMNSTFENFIFPTETILENWNVRAVNNFSSMFKGADFTSAPLIGDLGAWETWSATDMSEMFSNILGFDQNLSGWDVTYVNNCEDFDANSSLNTIHIPDFIDC